MTPPQDSVSDVERQAREILAARGKEHFARNILLHGRDPFISVTASTALDAIIAALAVPIYKIGEDAE